jgi:hypothetical protein
MRCTVHISLDNFPDQEYLEVLDPKSLQKVQEKVVEVFSGIGLIRRCDRSD